MTLTLLIAVTALVTISVGAVALRIIRLWPDAHTAFVGALIIAGLHTAEFGVVQTLVAQP